MQMQKLSANQRGWLWARIGIRCFLVLSFVLVVWKFLPPLFSLFSPFILALIVAASLNPLVRHIQKHIGLNRKSLSFFLLFILVTTIGSILGALIYFLASEIISLAHNWSEILGAFTTLRDQLQVQFANLLSLLPPFWVQQVETTAAGLFDWLREFVPSVLIRFADGATQRAIAIPSFFLSLLMFVMGAYFISSDYPYLRTRFLSRLDEGTTDFFRQIKTIIFAAFGGYLRSQFILSVGVFCILLTGFVIVGQSYALILALSFAVLDFIPIIGAGTIMVPWAVLALLSGDYITAIQIMIIWGVVLLFRRTAEPKILGDQTGISPIASLISIYVGMKVAGVAGMIFGPILCMIVLNIAGLGLFRSWTADFDLLTQDIGAILSENGQNNP